MFHSKIRAGEPIHAAYCTCRECRDAPLEAAFALDIYALAAGLWAGLFVIGVLVYLGIR